MLAPGPADVNGGVAVTVGATHASPLRVTRTIGGLARYNPTASAIIRLW